MKNTFFLILFALIQTVSSGQADRWQQKVEYDMSIDMDASNHQYQGEMDLTYFNNSPDDLNEVFFHLYFNAFQPGSMMDVRSRTIEDPDPRVGDRIAHLSPEEEGWIRVSSIKLNGKKCTTEVQGTILKVKLPKSIRARSSVKLELSWLAQVPTQIRRSGWMNEEGVEFSMTQWYPKMCEYDYQGWHANPYVGREFYGIWGDFDVKITMDGKYMIGGTGILQNPTDVGYTGRDVAHRNAVDGDVEWHFKAENVHDFAWAADPDFVVSYAHTDNGTKLIFIHQDDEEINENWKELEKFATQAFDFFNEHFGEYPYSQYTFIQGGDGGMEYPMTTLITGNRSLRSLVGVSVHEAAHSWFQGVLATNESLYEWMDEGFTSYATAETMRKLFGDNGYPTHHYAYQGYFNIIREGMEEPLITHSDHYTSNFAYGTAAYSKGEVLLAQLGYVIGEHHLQSGLLNYFNTWKFKHPNPNDFKRIMEKESGIELDWYFEYFENSTHTIDYAISEVVGIDAKVNITLEKVGLMPMPLDVGISYSDGSKEIINIPLRMMRSTKGPDVHKGVVWTEKEAWPWTNPTYSLQLDVPIYEIKSITIDPLNRMADVDKSNNVLVIGEGTEFIWKH